MGQRSGQTELGRPPSLELCDIGVGDWLRKDTVVFILFDRDPFKNFLF